MNSARQAAIAAAASALIALGAGCAGPAPADGEREVTAADRYRASVEAEARRQGFDVLWANPPRPRPAQRETAAADESAEVIRLRRQGEGGDDDGAR